MTAPGSRDDEHRAWDELAVGWSLHALEPEDEADFTAHLAGCARCARTVAETAEVMTAMAGDLPQAEPSEGLRDRLRAAVEETEQVPPRQVAADRPAAAPPAGQGSPPAAPVPAVPDRGNRASDLGALPPPPRVGDDRPAWRRVLPTALAAAAVAAVLALSAWNVALIGDRDSAQAAADQQSALVEQLLEPGRATIAPLTDDGTRVATVVARDDQLQVVAEGLPVNDSHDTVYVVWGMRSGSPEAIGTFDVVTPQTDVRTVGSESTGLDAYGAYAISIEPGRQRPSAPTEIVATGQVDS